MTEDQLLQARRAHADVKELESAKTYCAQALDDLCSNAHPIVRLPKELVDVFIQLANMHYDTKLIEARVKFEAL